jgi:VPDSG-CTERM motif
VATETDHIVVGGAAVPDSGSALILLGLATASLGALRRKLA